MSFIIRGHGVQRGGSTTDSSPINTTSSQIQKFIPPSTLNSAQRVLRAVIVTVALVALALSAAFFAKIAFPLLAPFAVPIAVGAFAVLTLVVVHTILNKRAIRREITLHNTNLAPIDESQLEEKGKGVRPIDESELKKNGEGVLPIVRLDLRRIARSGVSSPVGTPLPQRTQSKLSVGSGSKTTPGTPKRGEE